MAKGQLTSSTRYVSGSNGTDAFTSTVTSYDDDYRPLSITTDIPSSLNMPWLPSGSYTTSMEYNADGSTKTLTYPAAGNLPAIPVSGPGADVGSGCAGRDPVRSPDRRHVERTADRGVRRVGCHLLAAACGRPDRAAPAQLRAEGLSRRWRAR
ncbi:hypothetical protein GCM10027610_072160 [Dactylosporangium cerinum]